MSTAIAVTGERVPQIANESGVSADLEPVKRAAERARKAEASLADARDDLRTEIVRAVRDGASYSEAARAAGVSRQWVAQLVRDAR